MRVLSEFGKFYLQNSKNSDIIRIFENRESGPVAQLVEHRPFKAGVLGPNPSRLTILNHSTEYKVQPTR